MRKWYPIFTQINKEFFLKNEIERLGFETYLPITKKNIRHARKTTNVLKPLFPRYLFVFIDKEIDNWFFLNTTQGVEYFLKNNNRILSVENDIITNLKNLEKQKGYIDISDFFKFKKGDIIKVKEGPFKGFFGKFSKYTNNKKFNLFISLFNRELNITLPGSFFEPVI